MTLETAIIVGLFAFIGTVIGHLVSFKLNATAKRHEVRRSQIERLAEFLSEDNTWTRNYGRAAMWGSESPPSDTSPYDRAFAIYVLYFPGEMVEQMKAVTEARQAFIDAINNSKLERMEAASASGKALAAVPPTEASRDKVWQLFSPYYKAILAALSGASDIVHASLKAESRFDDLWGNIARRIRGGVK